MTRIKEISGAYFLGFLMCLAATFTVNQCSEPKIVYDTIRTETRVIYDSTAKFITPKAPPVARDTFFVPIPVNMDTNLVKHFIKLFLATYTYSQVIQDTSIRAIVSNTISQNRILSQNLSYQWLKPVETIKNTTITLAPEAKMGLFIGGFFDYSKEHLSVGPKASLKTKKNLLIGYDFDALNKGHRVSLQQLIKW